MISQLITSATHKDPELIGRPERDGGEEKRNSGRRKKLNEGKLESRIRGDGQDAVEELGRRWAINWAAEEEEPGQTREMEESLQDLGWWCAVAGGRGKRGRDTWEAGSGLSRQNVERKMI